MLCNILTYNIRGLPWTTNQTKHVCAWLKTLKPNIICLQEVFREDDRQYLSEHLTREGYTVVLPRDGTFSFLPSGLLTAVLEREYEFVRDCFCPFLEYHNLEILANKGFHAVHLVTRKTGKPVVIINTHTQPDGEATYLFGANFLMDIRKKQLDQIAKYVTMRDPALLCGDLNCEYSPHPHIRFVTSSTHHLLRKRTFYESGEDLDHIAWFPLQWANPDCSWCDILRNGPRLESIQIFQKPWSDHAPVLFTVYIPEKPAGIKRVAAEASIKSTTKL